MALDRWPPPLAGCPTSALHAGRTLSRRSTTRDMPHDQTVLEPSRARVKPSRGRTAKAVPNGVPAAPRLADPERFREAVLAKLTYSVGKDPAAARDHDWFAATALAVRDA